MGRWVVRHLAAVIIGGMVAINVGWLTTDLVRGYFHDHHTTSTWVQPVIIIDPDLPRCATEDSVSCVWVGPEQGNRRGAVVINGPDHR